MRFARRYSSFVVPTLAALGDGPTAVDLAGHAALQPTIDFFKGCQVEGTTPFKYEKDFENIGIEAALEGSPNLIEQEVMKGNPAFALLMFGSLNLYYNGDQAADRDGDPHIVENAG